MLYQLSYSRKWLPRGEPFCLLEGGGIEPPKSFDGRFTVCSLWPLGNPSEIFSELAMGLEPATC